MIKQLDVKSWGEQHFAPKKQRSVFAGNNKFFAVVPYSGKLSFNNFLHGLP